MKWYFLSKNNYFVTIFLLLVFLFWVTYSVRSTNYLSVPNSAQWTWNWKFSLFSLHKLLFLYLKALDCMNILCENKWKLTWLDSGSWWIILFSYSDYSSLWDFRKRKDNWTKYGGKQLSNNVCNKSWCFHCKFFYVQD